MVVQLLPDLADKSVTCFNKYHSVYPTSDVFKHMKLIVLLFTSVNDSDSDLVPSLIVLHGNARKHNIRLEILYVPTDIEPSDSMECFAKQGNWYSLEHQSGVGALLTLMYDVTSTPRVIVIQKDGKLVSDDGEADIRQYGSNAIVAWS